MELWIPLGLLAIVLSATVQVYNRLVRLRNAVREAFGTIDVMLKKRHDLIPSLVSAVRGAMTHERELLERVTELRTRAASGALAPEERIDVELGIGKALGRIMVAVENYPQLKANENVLHLQASLNEVEEQISAARRFYNTAVTDYNTAIQSFPAMIPARALRYEPEVWFRIGEDERSVPSLDGLHGERV
jgi:LemA protein